MNEIVGKFILAADKFITEMNLRQQDLHVVLADYLQKTKKEYINLKKQKIQERFTKTN